MCTHRHTQSFSVCLPVCLSLCPSLSLSLSLCPSTPHHSSYIIRWNHYHRTAHCNGQDQPALRLAIAEATSNDPTFIHAMLDAEIDPYYKTHPSGMPFNCRARDLDDNDNPQDDRGQVLVRGFPLFWRFASVWFIFDEQTNQWTMLLFACELSQTSPVQSTSNAIFVPLVRRQNL